MELVSIVITCFNADAFVADAIDAALGQTYPAVEVVVADDASTDASREVVARYGERVRAVHLPENGGAARARNAGAARARGGRLLFLDADDLIAPDTVEGLMEAARRAPGSVAACGWEFLLRRGEEWVPHLPERPLMPTGDPLAGWLAGEWVPICALLYPREAYERAGRFDESVRRNDDGDLAMRVFAGGAGLEPATRGKAFYRRHQGTRRSVSNDNQSARALRSQVRVLDKLSALLASQDRLEPYRALIEVQYGRIAMHAFEVGNWAVARECLARGGRGAAEGTRSAALAGRLLTAVVGIERKYRITRVLRGWRAALRGGAA